MLVLEGLVGLHKTGQLQFLWHQWLGHGLGSLSTRKGTQCGGKKKKLKETKICIFNKRRCKECKSIEKSYAWLGFSMIGLNLVGKWILLGMGWNKTGFDFSLQSILTMLLLTTGWVFLCF